MITKPGIYAFHIDQYDFQLIQVFEYFPKGDCWSHNTILSRPGLKVSLKDGENSLIMVDSSFHEESFPVSKYNIGYFIKIIFEGRDDLVMGPDYD